MPSPEETVRTALEFAGVRPADADIARLLPLHASRQPTPYPKISTEPATIAPAHQWQTS